MVLQHIVTHGLIYTIIFNGSLFVIMISVGPRVWGYNDYSELVKKKVLPKTKKEKMLSMIIGIPWLIIMFLLPIISTYLLKIKLGGDISFLIAFLNLFVLIILATIGDLVILDWIIVSKITPKFVIIPGTEAKDYKDFSHHYISHVKVVPILIILCLIIAVVVWYF